MEAKGYLHPDGRVRSAEPGSIGQVLFHETRYNLRRVIVDRSWWVRLADGRSTAAHDRRGDAVAEALELVGGAR